MTGAPESGRHDALDLREVSAALWRGKAWLLAFVAAGLLAGILVLLLAQPRYEATASVVLRSADGSSGALSFANSLPLGLGGAFGGPSMLETELEVLTSRTLLGAVVDSLQLQVEVLEPRRTPVRAVVAEARFTDIEDPLTLEVVRAGDAYQVRGAGADVRVMPGEAAALGGGTLTLATGALPAEFTLRIAPREVAISGVRRRIRGQKAGGDVARLTYTADDPRTAADALNLLLDRYMEWRRTTDRGVNQHRYEFLRVQADSLAGALAEASSRLREYQESSGVIDPALSGETDLTRAMTLRAEMETLEVEARALGEVADGRIPSARELAAYPTLLTNPAINGILSRLLDLDAERADLLERRTEADPDVILLTEKTRDAERELVALARSYVGGVQRKRAQVARELTRYDALLGSLPAQAQQIFGMQREVKRLSETQLAVEGQLVQTRLAAIGEGGHVRPLDRAVAPRRPVFPNPVVSLGLGVFGGLFFGIVGAFMAGRARPIVHEAWEAELATGIPSVRLEPGGPLLLGLLDRHRTVLVLPVGDSARPRAVAERLASTGALQGHRVVLADLQDPVAEHAPPRLAAGPSQRGTAVQLAGHGEAIAQASRPEDAFSAWSPDGDRAPLALRGSVHDLEGQFERTIVILPGLRSSVTVALLGADRPLVLAAGAASVSRRELDGVVMTLAQQGLPVAAVVLHDAKGRGRRS